MLCKNCSKQIFDDSAFCNFCGSKVEKEPICPQCGTKLPESSKFCNKCGTKVEETVKLPKAVPVSPNSAVANLTVGFQVSAKSINPLYFKKETSEQEKSIIRKLKKSKNYGDILLYDKENNIVYLRREGDSRINAFTPDNLQVPIAKYTLPENADQIWTSYSPTDFYFYRGIDAFFAWDAYIFLSVYNGQIAWAATDSRDELSLQGRKADEYISDSGTPEIEFLPNGNLKSTSFYNSTECRIEKGVLIPI